MVQPRMGMSDPEAMAAGIAAVAGLGYPAVATITVDSYPGSVTIKRLPARWTAASA